MKPVSRKLLMAVCAVFSFIALFLVLYLPVQPKGEVLASDWKIQVGEDSITSSLPYQQSIQGLTTAVFTKQITYKQGDALVLTGLKGQAVQVLLNDHTIFALGDFAAPSANIWNKTFLVPLPEGETQPGTLEIHLSSASFPISISTPPYILDKESAGLRVALIDFIYGDLLMISIGGSILIGMILIILSLLRKKSWNAEVFMGIASIFGAVETFDYQFRVSTGSLSNFLFTKKILMIAGYLAAFFFVVGMEKYYCDKFHISKYLAIPSIFTVVVISIQTDLVIFSELLTILNLLMLVDLVVAVTYIIKSAKSNDLLIIPAIWLILGFLQLVVVQVFHLNWPYVLSYIILMSTVVFGINMLIEFNRVFLEKEDLEKRIDIDTLTTAYNRNVLGKASKKQYDVLILMDLDNFKSYNDRHGHQKGDRILIQFAEIVKNNMRPNDLVVRYGGDEFLVLLSDIGIIDAERVAARIRKEFEELTINDQLSVSYGIEKIVHSIDSDLTKADRLMYAMKQAKREQKK
jgi:diguanylate cyclase (GGDEF)-like protein